MAGTTDQDTKSSPEHSSSKPTDEEPTPDVHDSGLKIERAREAYGAFTGLQLTPTRVEIWVWYFYELCSYSVLTTLLPIVFPLIIGNILVSKPPAAGDVWTISRKGFACKVKEMHLYHILTQKLIYVNNLNFSPLVWTSISWFLGLILVTPFLGFISAHLDHGCSQQLAAAAAIAVGSLFCLPVGFFQTVWIFALYIAPIVAAYVVASASHTRQLGLMVRGFTEPTLQASQFPRRRSLSGWLSVYATAAGCLGSAIISAFTYHMLRRKELSTSLWVASIFSGLKWLAGMAHVICVRPGADVASPLANSHFLAIFKYPHAIGSLIVVFLSSFTSMCIFTGGMLYLVGYLCLKPVFVLYLWLIYFIFPSFSLPQLQLLQHVIKANAVKMQVLGYLLAILTSGAGYYCRDNNWHKLHILIFAAIQSTSAGLLHAFRRVLLLDCAPHGNEGAFSIWYSWIKALGTCAGFTMASAIPGNMATSFRVAFCTALLGKLVLIFGNISDIGGAKAAGLFHEDGEDRGPSPVSGVDTSIVVKEPEHHEVAEP